MARKEPFKRISVSERILEALEKCRKEEHKRDYRIPPMNAFCEKILWDYSQGELRRVKPESTTEQRALQEEALTEQEQRSLDEMEIGRSLLQQREQKDSRKNKKIA